MNCFTILGVIVLITINTVQCARVPQDGIPRVFPCPIDADFLPCVCTEDETDFSLSMDCSNAKKDSDLTDAFLVDFPFDDFHELIIDQTTCDDCQLTNIAQGTFGNIRFERVTIIGTKIETIYEEAFGNSHETLKYLKLANNLISTYNFEAIKSYVKLTNLLLNGNRFESTTQDDQIPNIESESLRVINLSNNPKLTFSADIIKACPLIREADFRSGAINDIPLQAVAPFGMLTGLKGIEKIAFTSNSITDILSETLVPEEDTLTEVDFSHNSVTNVFPNFVKGKFVYPYNNY